MKNNIKTNLLKTIPYALTTALLFSGCGEKSECELPTRHVHKYIKQVEDDITIEKYILDEQLNIYGYIWQNEYIEVNKVDEMVYKLLRKNGLFEGSNNWEYLFNLMANQEDYLEFYYEYTTIEKYTTTDENGEEVEHQKEVVHKGWTKKPNYAHNTGKIRLYHHQFYGFKLIYENDKFKLESSPLVDDIRDVIAEYPYFDEFCVTKIYKEFKFAPAKLKYLTPNDFDVFESPDLENPNLEESFTRIKK